MEVLSYVMNQQILMILIKTNNRLFKIAEEAKRDLLYIDDLVDFIEQAIEKQKTPYELYHVGLGKAISVSNLAKKIIEVSGKNLKIKYGTSKPTIKISLCVNTNKARNDFGWSHKISLEEGIRRTIDWYKENINY